ncbi:hypothetical protein [Conexibacter sp. CPCC 206217]|uniref:hypothetical protein n=1 Tax=Conexibacter sp. CPCC 206217 TaxID=3064574 RepID=UPI002723B32A|nr:hypothetical protein [Conexibacter sp. CPCC 206217]MDO8212837.1 hypothetical protein [Conexibacter sp. CPCC 206217]
MRSKTSKGVAVLCVVLLGMTTFVSSASAAFDVYWEGWGGPGSVQAPPHTLTEASARTISGQNVCVQSYHTPANGGARAGGLSCNNGVNALATVNYPCACTLLVAVTAVGSYTNFRARVDF